MKVLRVFLVLVIVTVCLVSLTTCRQILYYLSQVYKVHGTVTVAETDPPTPLGSVEVFVGDYQYSELTNYYGDYEMEMAEGTWTINFRKEGCDPVTAEVTLGPEIENQRVRLDVSMVWNLTGHWDAYLIPEGGERATPHLLYLKQNPDSSLDGYELTGSVDGLDVEMSAEEGYATISGTIGTDGTVSGTMEGGFGDGDFEMERSNLSYGFFELSEMVSLNTNSGLGFEEENESGGKSFAVVYLDEHLDVWLIFDADGGSIATGTFSVPGPIRVMFSYGSDDGSSPVDAEEEEAMLGDLVITYTEGVSVEGSFVNMVFPSGTLSGSFEVPLTLQEYD